MPYNFSKAKLEKFSLFSISSKKFGYGHYNRIQNLILILKNKKNKIKHYSYGEQFKNKNDFINKINSKINSDNKVILDITNKFFLDSSSLEKIKKILIKKRTNKIYIIDEPTKNNLSIFLNLKNIKTFIPFEVNSLIKKKLSKIKKKAIGFQYFIYPSQKIKKKNKIYDITLSFGGSDNYGGTYRVLKLLKKLNLNKNIIIIKGKYFKKDYSKKIILYCKKNNFKVKTFSKNFNDVLNKTTLLITNSGLTKYEGIAHGLPVIVFSDNKESQKIDKIFINKTKQFHFSYLKRHQHDILKLKNILNKQLQFKLFDKNKNRSYMNKIKNFFYK